MSGTGNSPPQPGPDLPDGPVPGFTRFNLREQIKDGKPAEEIADAVNELNGHLDEAEAALS